MKSLWFTSASTRLARARRLIYLEDQYIWSPHVVRVFADALARNPDLRMIAVVPHYADRDSPAYNAPQMYARSCSLHQLRQAGGDRVFERRAIAEARRAPERRDHRALARPDRVEPSHAIAHDEPERETQHHA